MKLGSDNVHFRQPNRRTLQALHEQVAMSDPVNPPGLIDQSISTGFTRHEWSRACTTDDLHTARQSIRTWAGHREANVTLWPSVPEICVGETLVMAVPLAFLYVTAACRIVQVIDDADRFGFTYSTLPHHPESGEERFIVSQAPDGSITVTITALSRPNTLAAQCVPPITNRAQQRITQRYLDGFTRFNNAINV